MLDRIEIPFRDAIRREKNRFIVAQADYFKARRQLSEDLLHEHKNQLSRIIKKYHRVAIRVFSGDTSRNLPKSFEQYEKKRDLFALLLAEWVNLVGADRVQGISETTHGDLRRVLLAGIASEEPANKIIEKLLAVRSFSASRAATIARTETHGAAMFASKRTAEVLATDSTLQILKRWQPALDERTRASHAGMINHKAIEMDALFSVGGERMDRPSDPRGSARNVINCRCVLVYEEKET